MAMTEHQRELAKDEIFSQETDTRGEVLRDLLDHCTDDELYRWVSSLGYMWDGSAWIPDPEWEGES